MSLRNKILLLSLIPVTAVIVAVISVAMLHVRSKMLDAAKANLDNEVKITAQVIDEANRETVRLTEILARLQEHGTFGKREESLTITSEVLATYPRFIAAYFGYEPNADGQDRAWRARMGANHPSHDGTGRFLPYRFRNLAANGRIDLEPLVDMESSLYYDGLRKKFAADQSERFIITEPYIYNNQNMIIEQTSPIIIGGEFMGVAGIDRGLDSLDEYLQSLKPYELADLTLISNGGRIVATTLNTHVGFDLRTVSINEVYLNEHGGIAVDLFSRIDGKTRLDPAKATPARLATLNSDFIKELTGFVANAEKNEVRQFTGLLTGTELFGVSAAIPTGGWTLIMTVDAEHVTAPVRATLLWVILVALLGIGLIAGALTFVARQISRRIATVSDKARQVADGDLTAQIEVESDDETGRLQQSIKDMLGSLNGLLGKVKLSSISLMSTANEIAAGAHQQDAAVNEFSSSTNEITAAAKEISATSQELLGTMNDLNKVADQTRAVADQGHSGLGGMASTMEQLTHATGAISSRLATISEKAGNINVVVTTISKVADQTNLLSLNASIEAEKAGEYGLGFAVVAREIRRLADQTAASTLDIEQMVKEMQTAVSSGVMEMDKFTDEVRRGASEVQHVGSQLEDIIEQVQTLTAQFATVTEGMQSQSEGARQISDALAAVSDGVQQTAETVKSFHRATESLQQSVKDLRTEVSRFKMDESVLEPPAGEV